MPQFLLQGHDDRSEVLAALHFGNQLANPLQPLLNEELADLLLLFLQFGMPCVGDREHIGEALEHA